MNWISVKDRLPLEGQRITAIVSLFPNRKNGIAERIKGVFKNNVFDFGKDGQCAADSGFIVSWKPEPPQGDEE